MDGSSQASTELRPSTDQRHINRSIKSRRVNRWAPLTKSDWPMNSSVEWPVDRKGTNGCSRQFCPAETRTSTEWRNSNSSDGIDSRSSFQKHLQGVTVTKIRTFFGLNFQWNPYRATWARKLATSAGTRADARNQKAENDMFADRRTDDQFLKSLSPVGCPGASADLDISFLSIVNSLKFELLTEKDSSDGQTWRVFRTRQKPVDLVQWNAPVCDTSTRFFFRFLLVGHFLSLALRILFRLPLCVNTRNREQHSPRPVTASLTAGGCQTHVLVDASIGENQ